MGVNLPPEEWGWIIKKNYLLPKLMNRSPAPATLMKLVRCNCKTGCENNLVEKITLSEPLFAETVKVSPVTTIKIMNRVKLSDSISVCLSYCQPSWITAKFISHKLSLLYL